MNKKFSTLVAVLLAAGAWTTLDAKVVEVTTPVPGGSYVIGSVFTDGSAVLLQSDDAAVEGTQTVSSATGKWTLVDASSDYSGCFYLKGDADKFIAAGNGSTDAATLSLKTEGELSTTHAKVPFSYINGELVVASAFTNNNVKDKELNIAASSIVAVADASAQHTALFGVYAADSKVPGFDLNVNDDGQLIFTDDVAAPNFAAPVYFQINSKYLYVSGKDVKVDMDAAPKAGEAVGASWRWENGKFVSVAAENADADVKAKYLNVVLKEGALAYSLVEKANATTFAIKDNAITATTSSTPVSLTSPVMYASAVLANAQAKTEVPIAGGSNVVAGDLQILNVPSGAVVISLQKDGTTKYLKAGESNSVNDIELTATLTNGDPKEYEKYLWNVSSKTLGGKAYYTFTSLAKNGDKNYVAFEEYQANAVYSKQGITLGDGSQFVGINGTLGNAPAVIGFYDAFQLAKTQAQLDGIYSPGFEMTVKVSKDGKETIEDIDVFGKTMYPKASKAANVGETTVQLWDNNKTDAKGAKLLALDKTKTFDSTSPIVGEFVWITPTELTKNSANYETGFQFIYSLGDPALIEEVKVDGLGSLYIFKASDKYYLTVNKAVNEDTTLPYIKLEGSNIYDVKKLLGQYLSFSYADTKANTPALEEYKLDGMLAVTKNTAVEADFITGTSATLPEAQWAVTAADKDNNTFTLTNRENASIQLTGVQLREVGNKFVMTASGGNGNANITSDLVTLTTTALNKTTNFDGYMQSTPNVLRNENFYLGQYHAVEGNNHAYFVENHTDKASHQIGMTAEKENAQKWNLQLATKADEKGEYTLVDTVKVPLVFATLIDGKIVTDVKNKDVVKDTLFILPYAFQNASNREFVSYKKGKGFEYYFCNKAYKENDDVNEAEVIKFALKMKPDNTYNFVELNMAVNADNDALGTNKVLGGNSANKGVISRVETYNQNANSLMVVEKADAPEYHKIAMAWGDTIKLFRDENNSQVVYEKQDVKSVVEKDTLSFLNIDNINQFKVNPAIFADTAYINRVDANGELNTCYQYLLAVNVDPEKSYYCPYNPEHNTDEWRKEHNGPCADAKEHRAVHGRYLINLIDTANVYGATHLHNNPYINDVEADEHLAKLSFVEGYHIGDTLIITRKGGEAVKLRMDTPDFNVAKFAFRYVNSSDKTFKIQTQYKEYDPEADADEIDDAATNNGYLKWVNGTLAVTGTFENGDVFGIEENYEGNPTANEDITTSSISVIAKEGAVIIKGAAGKKVTISNVLGQTVANAVITSDEATITAPAGIVVVAVEGEAAVKAIVK
ncbi:hypothetical protein DXD68_22715 [Parabacteroides sp. TM07-1AC]|uniref:DUF6383 domain-containing protein n=1 Tax=Parabacteroides sp. TM07-1AC TaxID=2292363 RepID=UPI000EFEB67F|nr:DUF6383 domain-containing protein [Parabacteroides sp. TM07-1AC]RHU22043.1 hypothetical protein DXD68_22715 [Parabacteroides sp. TM07-1AC]